MACQDLARTRPPLADRQPRAEPTAFAAVQGGGSTTAVKRCALVLVASLALAPAASAGGSAWAAKANAVCRSYVAQAKAALSKQPKTPAEARTWTATAVSIESAELAALEAIPGPTAAGGKALAAVRTDIAEAKAALAAKGNAKFAALFARWGNDKRPKQAFLAAGARDCG